MFIYWENNDSCNYFLYRDLLLMIILLFPVPTDMGYKQTHSIWVLLLSGCFKDHAFAPRVLLFLPNYSEDFFDFWYFFPKLKSPLTEILNYMTIRAILNSSWWSLQNFSDGFVNCKRCWGCSERDLEKSILKGTVYHCPR